MQPSTKSASDLVSRTNYDFYAASIFGYGHPFIDQGSPFTGNEFYDYFLIWLGKRLMHLPPDSEM